LGQILDTIRRVEVLSDPETVNVDWTSEAFSLDNREGEFSVFLAYEGGSTVEMTLSLQLSFDGINFSDVVETEQEIIDNDGTHLWDILGTGALFGRVKITVTSGSIDVTQIAYAGKQRH
jgi:hypothetical protein